MKHALSSKRPKAISILKTTILFLLVALICLGSFSISTLLGMDVAARLDPSKIYGADQSTLVFDAQGTEIANIHGLENRIWIPLSQVPKQVQEAFISAEDVRFYSHSGVDIKRIFGALIQDIKAGSLEQGASTITQQLIKNSMLHRKKTWSRKIEEALLAIELERRYSKDEILEMYLNYNYFGAGAYGIEAAAQTYFSKSASELSVAEGASLAAILKSPTNYAPHLHPENNEKRRNTILSLMHDYGYLDESAMTAAQQTPLELHMQEEEDTTYGWYTDAALEQAADLLQISYEELTQGGYRIHTAMDAALQKECEDAFADASLFPADAADGTQAQAAAVMMDPQTGRVLALIGGRSYTAKRGFNRALDMKRQPGSTIKPLLVYAPVLQNKKFVAASLFIDEPTAFGDYEPRNSGDKYYGEVTLRTSAVRSLNIPTIKMLEAAGIEECKAFAQSIGIPFSQADQGLSLALGGFDQGISPLELCRGYAMLAAGGTVCEPSIVTAIYNASGQLLYQASSNKKRVMSKENAYILNDILTQVITEGTGKALSLSNVPLAGKTGTNAYGETGIRDAWMAAYNQEIAAVVWMGFDETDDAHVLSSNVQGGGAPAKVLRSIFSAHYKDRTGPSFVQPDTVVRVRLQKTQLQQGILQIAEENDSDVVEDLLPIEQLPTQNLGQNAQCAVYHFTILQQTQGHPQIRFSATSSAAQYAIMRQGEDGTVQQLSVLPYAPVMTYTDTAALPGMGYTYWIQPVDTSGQASGPASQKLFHSVPAA